MKRTVLQIIDDINIKDYCLKSKLILPMDGV